METNENKKQTSTLSVIRNERKDKRKKQKISRIQKPFGMNVTSESEERKKAKQEKY